MDAELWRNLLRVSAHPHTKKAWTDRELIGLLLVTPTPIIADAMEGRNVLTSLKPLLSSARIAGPVITAQTDSMDWGTTVRAIESASVGDVLFIHSSSSAASVWGGLASRAAQRQGLAGTIVCGSCRDITTIRKLKYPTWARTTSPRAGKPLNQGMVNVPLVVSRVQIYPRDLVKADEEGVVIIPAASRETIANKIVSVAAKEQFIEDGLRAGKRFSDLINDFSS
ncbi:MAG: RraA family protein [Halobacteriota archaeon]